MAIISCYNAIMWFIYIVRCADNTLYTGITTDVKRRVDEHNGGTGAKYTQGRRPVILVYTESTDSRSHALKREAIVKRLSKKEKEHLLGDLDSNQDSKIQSLMSYH